MNERHQRISFILEMWEERPLDYNRPETAALEDVEFRTWIVVTEYVMPMGDGSLTSSIEIFCQLQFSTSSLFV